MQVGVALVDPNNRRLVQRGGGADFRYQLADKLAGENCSEICYWGLMEGGLGAFWWQLPLINGSFSPYYLKCIEAAAAAPLNGLRLQHASQFNTMDLDPAVRQMNITDWSGCIRMLFDV